MHTTSRLWSQILLLKIKQISGLKNPKEGKYVWETKNTAAVVEFYLKIFGSFQTNKRVVSGQGSGRALIQIFVTHTQNQMKTANKMKKYWP